MPNNIHFYGEKGLVTALFLDLEASGNLIAFLNSIDFPFPTPHRLACPLTQE